MDFPNIPEVVFIEDVAHQEENKLHTMSFTLDRRDRPCIGGAFSISEENYLANSLMVDQMVKKNCRKQLNVGTKNAKQLHHDTILIAAVHSLDNSSNWKSNVLKNRNSIEACPRNDAADFPEGTVSSKNSDILIFWFDWSVFISQMHLCTGIMRTPRIAENFVSDNSNIPSVYNTVQQSLYFLALPQVSSYATRKTDVHETWLFKVEVDLQDDSFLRLRSSISSQLHCSDISSFVIFERKTGIVKVYLVNYAPRICTVFELCITNNDLESLSIFSCGL